MSICSGIPQCGNCIFRSRAVFGYDGKSNDLKVSETGGMSYGSCFFFSNISLFSIHCSSATRHKMFLELFCM